MSIFDDVHFDSGAASDAEFALTRLADAMDTMLEGRARLAANAREGWVGAARVDFDARVQRSTAAGADLAAACRSQAFAIASAAGAAGTEQQRRLVARSDLAARRLEQDKARLDAANRAADAGGGPDTPHQLIADAAAVRRDQAAADNASAAATPGAPPRPARHE